MIETAPQPNPAAPMRSRGHLWQIDIVRLLTFAAVISVHVLAYTEQPDNRAVAGMMMLLQFGRVVFFALSGFVLMYSTMAKPMRLWSFWRKRILFVAVPYVVWSFLYYLYDVFGPVHPQQWSWGTFGNNLLSGDSEYHLYFLLVTLQLYLVMPLIRAFVLRTARYAMPILGIVSVGNLLWMSDVQWGHPGPGSINAWAIHYAFELLPTYLMWVLAGCYAAVHIDKVQAIVNRYPRQLVLVAALAAAGALSTYSYQLGSKAPRVANSVLQPGSALVCLAAIIVVYLIGSRWASGRRRDQRLIELLSDASFGVYLAHPMVLQFMLDYGGLGNNGQAVPPLLATIAAYVITILGATIISVVARRTPLSLPLAGRPWRDKLKYAPAPRNDSPPNDNPESEALVLC